MRMRCFLATWLGLAGAAWASPTHDGLFVTLQTTLGDIVIETAWSNAPAATANFVGLAEGGRTWLDPRTGRVGADPYYNGIVFHRVISNFVIQAGSPQGTGRDGPGYVFPDRFDPALRHDGPGVVSMANSGPDSNGGQFFITVAATPWLDDLHTVFGRVVEGMSNVYAIASVQTDAEDRPLADVVITNTVVTRIGSAALSFSVEHPDLPRVSAAESAFAAPGDPRVTLSLSNLTRGVVYRSENLETWTSHGAAYRVTGGVWSASATQELAMFTAATVAYPMDTNLTASLTPGEWRMTLPVNTYTVDLGTGNLAVNTNPPAPLTFASWSREPLKAVLIADAVGQPPFRFELYADGPWQGRCRGFVFLGIWIPMENEAIGTWTFTPPP